MQNVIAKKEKIVSILWHLMRCLLRMIVILKEEGGMVFRNTYDMS